MVEFYGIKVDLTNNTYQLEDGTVLDHETVWRVSYAYERACTAQMLMEDYGYEDEQVAMDIASIARQLMADYPSMQEVDAVNEAIDQYNNEE